VTLETEDGDARFSMGATEDFNCVMEIPAKEFWHDQRVGSAPENSAGFFASLSPTD